MDVLLRTTRNRTGTGVEEQKKGRLGGILLRYTEVFEQKYVVVLSAFYDLVLKHHDKLTFTSEQIYTEEEALVEDLNRLWDDAVEVETYLIKVQEMGTKTIQLLHGAKPPG